MTKSAARVAIGLAIATATVGQVAAQKALPALEAATETTITTSAGQVTTSGRFYRSRDGRVREESPAGTIITDPKRRPLTLLNPLTKEAIVRAFPPSAQAARRVDAEARSVEDGTVEGHAVSKARQQREGISQELWTAKALGLVLFSDVESPGFRMKRSFKNLELREPDPELFRIPKDYNVITQELLAETTVPEQSPLGHRQRSLASRR